MTAASPSIADLKLSLKIQIRSRAKKITCEYKASLH